MLNPLAAADFRAAAPDELRRHYERLDRGLLSHWWGPMLNDSLVPHWTGVLRRMVSSWLPGTPPGALDNQLVAGGSDILSVQPARLLVALAGRARGNARLHARLAGDATSREVWEALQPTRPSQRWPAGSASSWSALATAAPTSGSWRRRATRTRGAAGEGGGGGGRVGAGGDRGGAGSGELTVDVDVAGGMASAPASELPGAES